MSQKPLYIEAFYRFLYIFLGFKRYETILELYVLYYIDIWDELLQTKIFSEMLLRKKHSHMVFLAFSEMNFVHTENHWKSIFCIIVADGELKRSKWSEILTENVFYPLFTGRVLLCYEETCFHPAVPKEFLVSIFSILERMKV